LIFLPAADIPTFVAEGRCDLGITGVDQVEESEVDVDLPLDLKFGKCKLQVQVPLRGDVKDPKQLIGKTIVSSFTKLTRKYFEKLEGVQPGAPIQTKIKYVGGSVEASCALGVADAIVDLVESGETMRAAGLVDIDTVLTTSAYLIQSKTVSEPELVKKIKGRIEGVLTAQKFVLCTYNAPREKLDELLSLTPGRRAPTVSPIDDDGWVAVSSMIERAVKGEVMDKLKDLGASDIMVMEISNCRV
jgi:ATP phosphoribosyltransferase